MVCESLDWDLSDGHRCFDVLRAESFVAAFEEVYRTQPETLGPKVRANVELATNPALSLPMGRDAAGMPFGIQLMGPLHRDARLLGMALAVETWSAAQEALRRPLPDMAQLTTPGPELRSTVTHPPQFGGGADARVSIAV